MKGEIPYRDCARCEFIEDCKHPHVNEFGKPEPPRECCKSDEIKLTKRSEPQRQ